MLEVHAEGQPEEHTDDPNDTAASSPNEPKDINVKKMDNSDKLDKINRRINNMKTMFLLVSKRLVSALIKLSLVVNI